MEGPAPSHNPLELVIKAIKLMKCGKAAGTSLIVAEMLKVSEVEGTQQIRDLIEDIIHFGKIPTEWEESIIVSLYKGKYIALERGNYRGLKLLDQVMKVLERVAENFLRQVRINDMQFGFIPVEVTTDAIFIVRQLQEKFYAINKTLYMAFVNLEKAFNHVPRRVIWWALCNSALMSGWCGSYRACIKTPEAECLLVATWVKNLVWKWAFTKALARAPYCSSRFWKPSPKSFVQDVPGNTLYADDLVIITESLEELQQKLILRKTNMEGKGFGSTWAKPRSWYLGRGSVCFRSLAKTPVVCVSRASAQIPFSVVVVPVGSTRNVVASLAVWSLMPASGVNGALDRPAQ